jgi:hypothetical protein
MPSLFKSSLVQHGIWGILSMQNGIVMSIPYGSKSCHLKISKGIPHVIDFDSA